MSSQAQFGALVAVTALCLCKEGAWRQACMHMHVLPGTSLAMRMRMHACTSTCPSS